MKIKKEQVTPVYLRSAEHGWVPALQLQTHEGKATVAVPKFPTEEGMMNCAKASKLFKYHDNQIIDLSKYDNEQLPMQNVDANGNLEDYHDMM